MKEELKTLIDRIAVSLSDRETSDKLLEEAMKLTETEQERKEAGRYLTAVLNRKRPDIDVKSLMEGMEEAVSLSYIARTYFGKDRSWIYQRINHSTVNGKPCSFSAKELSVLADALDDLSKKLADLSSNISLHI